MDGKLIWTYHFTVKFGNVQCSKVSFKHKYKYDDIAINRCNDGEASDTSSLLHNHWSNIY